MKFPIPERPRWQRFLNPTVTRKPKRLFEICDLNIVPSFIKHRCQAILTAEWAHRIPLLQKSSPAALAASLLDHLLDVVDKNVNSKLSVVDFCSGAGGPSPIIERLVNSNRSRRSLPAIPFVLTDIHPHLDSWTRACSKSANLSFIPQPVDATNPPISVISNPSSAADDNPLFPSDTSVFRLFCLAFHHFDDQLAQKVLRSTLDTSDGFAIVELQDRHLSSLILMIINYFLIYVVTLFWFWRDPIQLLLTYIVPVMPFIMAFDGTVSSLRTRTFEEILKLTPLDENGYEYCIEQDEGGRHVVVAYNGDWVFKASGEMHTWPFGHMNWVVGYKRLKKSDVTVARGNAEMLANETVQPHEALASSQCCSNLATQV